MRPFLLIAQSPESASGVGAIQLDTIDLAIAASLVLIAGIVSLILRLQLERKLAVAAVRTVVQLLAVGYILRWVFDLNTPWAIMIVVLLMIGAAARVAVQRPTRTYPGAAWRGFLTLFLCGIITTFVVTGLIIGVEPWYRPQYVIPLLGMVLGNSLTSISLTLDYLLEQLTTHADEVEMELSLGATRWEAARTPLAEAVRRGMIPTINAMMIVGIVLLPGMMTGQILAGADPFEAVKYQIVVMFMIAAAASMSGILTGLFTYHRLFTHKHQLRSSLITRKKG